MMKKIPPKKILVVNLRYFGDALISASLSVHIKKVWPEAHVTYLIPDRVKGILFGIDTIDEILTVPERASKPEIFSFCKKHYKEFDVAFLTMINTRPLIYAFLMGKEVVGFEMEKSHRNFWKTRLQDKSISEGGEISTVLRFDKLLTGYGCPPVDGITVPYPVEELPEIEGLQKDYVVLHPTPRCVYKRWKVQHWKDLIKKIQDLGLQVVISGAKGKEEGEYLNEILEEAKGVINLAGKLSFGQVAALIKDAKAFVGTDTSTTHVAAATGTPTIALFGPTSARAWGPWSPNQALAFENRVNSDFQKRGNVTLIQKFPYSKCPCGQKGCANTDESSSDCLHLITADQVMNHLHEFLRDE